mmetsp:Transcript_25383/g.59499  ORF Transcript_25383/g.59499 Transcript_25383/m.59499 type:complete len:162 (+) Transcript_25383:399-884(+)
MGSHGFVERFISDGELSLVAIKLLNFGFYALCYYAVMQPGRIDGQASQSASKDSKAPDIQDYTRRNSLVTPSNWAFAIWAFIFLGELLFVTSSSSLFNKILPLRHCFGQCLQASSWLNFINLSGHKLSDPISEATYCVFHLLSAIAFLFPGPIDCSFQLRC